MAEKVLKSIIFPNLSDKYIVPNIDDQKGQANGIAPLNADKKIDLQYLQNTVSISYEDEEISFEFET